MVFCPAFEVDLRAGHPQGRGGSLLEILNYLPDGGHFPRVPTIVQCDFRYRQVPMTGTCLAHE